MDNGVLPEKPPVAPTASSSSTAAPPNVSAATTTRPEEAQGEPEERLWMTEENGVIPGRDGSPAALIKTPTLDLDAPQDKAPLTPPISPIHKISRDNRFPTFLKVFPLYGWPPKDFYKRFTLGWGEIISGVTVSLAQLPEAVAWPMLAGVPVGIGLSASWVMALVTSLFGGRPGMVSGATGSTAVLMVDLVKNHPGQKGQILLFWAVMFAGLLQIVGFLLKGGKVLRLISTPVVYGFVNGLGLLIFFSQFASFKCPTVTESMTEPGYEFPQALIDDGCPGPDTYIPPDPDAPIDESGGHNPIAELGHGQWFSGTHIGMMMVLVVITMIFTIAIPRFSAKWPAALSGIAAASVVEYLIFDLAIGRSTVRIGEVGNPIKATYPYPFFASPYYNEPGILSLSASEFGMIAPVGFNIALVGIIESLLTEQLIDEITKTKSDATQEFLGQGLGNVISGLTGGMGGCAMIGQSMVNIDAGSRTRMSTIVAAICTFVILIGASYVVNKIPLGSLVGVMFVVVYRTIEWASIEMCFFSCMPKCMRDYIEKMKYTPHHIKKINRGDVVIIIAVTVLTLIFDLGTAVGVGLILSTIFYSWESGDLMKMKAHIVEMKNYKARKGDDDRSIVPVKIYEIDGPLCFSSVPRFLEYFDFAEEDPDYVEMHFHQTSLFGYSAVDALDKIGQRYMELDKQLVLRKVKQTCKKNLAKATNLAGGGVLIHEDITEVWDDKVELVDHHSSMNRARHSILASTSARRRSSTASIDGILQQGAYEIKVQVTDTD